MPIIIKNHKVWETEYYCIEAVIDNKWWESIIKKNIDTKLNLIFEQIIKNTKVSVLKKKFSISILLTGDKKINQLNKKFRKINAPTNVLSFPSIPINVSTNNLVSDYNNLNFLGDIIMSSDTLIKEANNEKKMEEDHFIHLFVHGILHLLGYDHKKNNDAKIMETLEIKILKNLNINNPYKKII